MFDQAVGRAFVVAAKDVAKEVSTRAKAVRAVQLSSAIALKAFTSLLPLLLAIVGIIGFISAGDSTIGNRMVDRLGLTGDLERVFRDNLATATSSRGIAGTIGLLGSLWTGLAVIKAIATACDAVWQVPERGIIDRLIGVPWFIGALIISVLSGLATAIVQFMPIPFVGGVVAWLASSVTGGALVWWTHRIMTNVRIPNTSHVPGAIVAGAALALFQVLGASIVPRLLASASQTYALLASVFVMLTLLTMLGNVIVYGAIINVVLWEHRHGTTTMVALVPALPSDPYVQLGRGGQRPRPPKRPGIPKRLKR